MYIIRSIIAVILGFLIVYSIPPLAKPSVITRLDLPAILIFVVLFGTVSSFALNRRMRIKEWLVLELNKIRRLYHLSKNMAKEDHLRLWFTDLHQFVYEYLNAFEKLSLREHSQSNPEFRKLAYHVYTIPGLINTKETVLYSEILQTIRVISEARQEIQTLSKARFWKHHWFLLLIVLILFVFAVLGSTTSGSESRFLSSIILSLGFLLVVFYLEHDVLTADSDRELSRAYVENIARLELKRH